MLLEEFFEGIALLEFGVVRHAATDIDVCRDPVAAAFVQDFADELAELLFFFFRSLEEKEADKRDKVMNPLDGSSVGFCVLRGCARCDQGEREEGQGNGR